MTLYERALASAAAAHKTQVRKHDNSPYIVHPVMVAQLLQQYGFSETVIAAGLVHDVLEDSSVTKEELRSVLGDEVVAIVTAVSEDKELPWEERKERYIQSVVASNEPVWAVSVADKIHNAESLIAHHTVVGPAVWQVFNRGKEKKIWFEQSLYAELSKVWQHPLLERYGKRIEEMQHLSD